MSASSIFVVFFMLVLMKGGVEGQPYEETWESLDQRPLPDWFRKMKFGIFVHWGVYTVPAYRCLRETEWTEW